MPQSPLPELIPNLEGTLAANMDLLKECRVRTVNVLFVQGQRNPRYFTFPHSLSTCPWARPGPVLPGAACSPAWKRASPAIVPI